MTLCSSDWRDGASIGPRLDGHLRGKAFCYRSAPTAEREHWISRLSAPRPGRHAIDGTAR